MAAQILDGKKISADIRAKVKVDVDNLIAQGITPGLAVVLVGDDPASHVYVRSKERACEEVGIYSEKHALPSTATQEELLAVVESLNSNEKIDGILVQLPLPPQIEEQPVLRAVDPSKDVDGFHPINVGKLSIGEDSLVPCTPHGVIKMLEFENIDIAGKHAVVIGRSNIVGKPIAMLLLNRSATVTVCHSKTHNLKDMARTADILVAAIGNAEFVTKDMIKPGAVVIDVGINRVGEKLLGDVHPDAAEVASWVTPVPGGVGPMTIAMLLHNTVKAARSRRGIR